MITILPDGMNVPADLVLGDTIADQELRERVFVKHRDALLLDPGDDCSGR